MNDLYHIIYASRASHPFVIDEIQDFLSECQKNNKENDVTGMLLYDNGCFFQIIEGEKDVLLNLFESIEADKRHDKVVVIISESIPKRNFGRWSMGYADVSRSDLSNLDGFNDFFEEGNSLMELDQNRAKKILMAFAAGRWHIS